MSINIGNRRPGDRAVRRVHKDAALTAGRLLYAGFWLVAGMGFAVLIVALWSLWAPVWLARAIYRELTAPKVEY